MTIGGWFIFAISAITIAGLTVVMVACWESIPVKILVAVLGVVIIIAILLGMFWWFNNTASGQRALTDQKSELANGLERIVRVYTANGDIIAEYEGIIDIEGNDGGYVLFDYQGKRYTYYNFFVESIAEIG